MGKENKAFVFSDEELEQVTGGAEMSGLGGTIGIGAYVFTVLTCGIYKCSCGDKPATRAMANHLVNEHGYTREQAMAAVPEELRSIQWD